MLSSAIWSGVLATVIVGYVAGGVNGARGNLHRILLGDSLGNETYNDPVVAISRGYELLLLCLMLTWALREIYAYLGKRQSPRYR